MPVERQRDTGAGPLRDTVLAAAIVAAGALVGLGAALSGRWHVSAVLAGAYTRTIIADAWTGRIDSCLTSGNKTTCQQEAQP